MDIVGAHLEDQKELDGKGVAYCIFYPGVMIAVKYDMKRAPRIFKKENIEGQYL